VRGGCGELEKSAGIEKLKKLAAGPHRSLTEEGKRANREGIPGTRN